MRTSALKGLECGCNMIRREGGTTAAATRQQWLDSVSGHTKPLATATTLNHSVAAGGRRQQQQQ
jgi:hypothetical protein